MTIINYLDKYFSRKVSVQRLKQLVMHSVNILLDLLWYFNITCENVSFGIIQKERKQLILQLKSVEKVLSVKTNEIYGTYERHRLWQRFSTRGTQRGHNFSIVLDAIEKSLRLAGLWWFEWRRGPKKSQLFRDVGRPWNKETFNPKSLR